MKLKVYWLTFCETSWHTQALRQEQPCKHNSLELIVKKFPRLWLHIYCKEKTTLAVGKSHAHMNSKSMAMRDLVKIVLNFVISVLYICFVYVYYYYMAKYCRIAIFALVIRMLHYFMFCNSIRIFCLYFLDVHLKTEFLVLLLNMQNICKLDIVQCIFLSYVILVY